jgi:hypothetical protein
VRKLAAKLQPPKRFYGRKVPALTGDEYAILPGSGQVVGEYPLNDCSYEVVEQNGTAYLVRRQIGNRSFEEGAVSSGEEGGGERLDDDIRSLNREKKANNDLNGLYQATRNTKLSELEKVQDARLQARLRAINQHNHDTLRGDSLPKSVEPLYEAGLFGGPELTGDQKRAHASSTAVINAKNARAWRTGQ